MEPEESEPIIERQYILELLESNSEEDEFAGEVLDFLVNLDPSAEVAFRNWDTSLNEMQSLARSGQSLMDKSTSLSDQDKQLAIALFLVHASNMWCKNMIDMLCILYDSVEKSVRFYEKYLKDDRHRPFLLRNHLTLPFSNTTMSPFKRHQEFSKLQQQLKLHAGLLTSWRYSLKEILFTDRRVFDDIDPFLEEMQNYFREKNPHFETGLDRVASFAESVEKSAASYVNMRNQTELWSIPNHFVRRWPVYAAGTTLIVVSAMIYKNMGYSFSNLGSHVTEAMMGFFQEHIIDPAVSIYRDLFTSRDKVELKRMLKEEKGALTTMIQDFETQLLENKYGGLSGEQRAQIARRAETQDMSVIMESFVTEVRNPLRNITNGALLQNVFVQMQQMKVEIAEIMTEVDKLMDANRINMEVMATMPAIALIGSIVAVFRRYMGRSSRRARARIRKIKQLFRDVHLIILRNLNEGRFAKSYFSDEDLGSIVFCMYQAHSAFFEQMKQGALPRSEMEQIQIDIVQFLAKNFTPDQRLILLKRLEDSTAVFASF